MIFLDTETTGLLKETAPLEEQPRIIEIAMIKVEPLANRQFLERSRFQCLVNPGIHLDPEITKITTLTDDDLKNASSFAGIARDLADFFLGETEVVAHNVYFDMMMLVNEMRGMSWEYRFPWPNKWIDTVPLSGMKKLNVWAQELLGEEYTPQTHRAMADVEMLLACWRKFHA